MLYVYLNRIRTYSPWLLCIVQILIELHFLIILKREHIRTGIRGGSNGGLLMGNMFVRRPDLFGAVCCAVPLLDMKAYHQLLAGASWMAEYGNPDVPEVITLLC